MKLFFILFLLFNSITPSFASLQKLDQKITNDMVYDIYQYDFTSEKPISFQVTYDNYAFDRKTYSAVDGLDINLLKSVDSKNKEFLISQENSDDEESDRPKIISNLDFSGYVLNAFLHKCGMSCTNRSTLYGPKLLKIFGFFEIESENGHVQGKILVPSQFKLEVNSK